MLCWGQVFAPPEVFHVNALVILRIYKSESARFDWTLIVSDCFTNCTLCCSISDIGRHCLISNMVGY